MERAQQIIDRIVGERRVRGADRGRADGAVRASARVYEDEPVLKTGRQLAREMAAQRRAPRAAFASGAPRGEARLGGAGAAAPHGTARASVGAGARDFSLFDLGAVPVVPACELPRALRELRALERRASECGWSSAQLFAWQARLAADYEDDFRYEGVFSHYFPTYRMMTDAQLRGYFAWRTQVRRGRIEKTSLSFAFVYLYELLNGIGYSTPEEGHELLCRFSAAYRALDARIGRYARIWADDFVVYHGLDRVRLGLLTAGEGQARADAGTRGASLEDACPEAFADVSRSERLTWEDAYRLLAEEEGRPAGAHEAHSPLSDERLAAVLSALASPGLARSRVWREHPCEMQALVSGTWRALSAYYRARRATSLFAHLFGVRAAGSYQMFRSAVFWEGSPHGDAVYEAGPLSRFICENGRWRCDCVPNAGVRSAELGRILKAVQRRGAERLGYECALKDPGVPKYLVRIIDKQIDALRARIEAQRAEEAAREARRVVIDFSKLAGIRRAASATCEALLIDEEREGAEGNAPQPAVPHVVGSEALVAHADAPHPVAPQPAGSRAASPQAAAPEASRGPFGCGSAGPAANVAGLTECEVAYLACLVEGAPADRRAAVLAQAGVLESLLVDAINEKLFEVLGDVAVEEGADGPRIVKDYMEDVKGCIGYGG